MHGWVYFAFSSGVFFSVLVRFGILPMAFAYLFFFGPLLQVLTPDLSVWYAGRSLFVVLLLAALAVYGFYISLAGRRVFRDPLESR